MKRVHVCSYVSRDGKSCPNLAPCELHGRPKNASWSKDRDYKQQARFRKAVLARDGYRCTRCGHHDPTGRTLEAHHLRPGYDTSDGVTVCTAKANGCHKALDSSAR